MTAWTIIGPWHWLIFGLLLSALELALPAFFLIWFGFGAACVALCLALFPNLSLEGQLALFAGFSLVSLAIGRPLLMRLSRTTDRPTLNRRGHQYIGRRFTLDTPIANGTGKIRIGDSLWKVSGADAPAGSQVEVTGVDGVVLLVRRAP